MNSPQAQADLDLRRVFGAYPTGVAVLAGLVDDRPVGLAANSFTSVSLDPPLVSVCLARSSATWPVLQRAERIGISVLADGQEAVSRQLAARNVDRFADVDWRANDHGCVLVEGAAAWFDCTVHDFVRAGDHDIVVFAVQDLDTAPEIEPLVFHASAYRRLV